MVEGEGYTTAVGMTVMAVAALLPLKVEAIGLKCGSELACGNRTELRILNCHTVTATTA